MNFLVVLTASLSALTYKLLNWYWFVLVDVILGFFVYNIFKVLYQILKSIYEEK